MRSVIKIGGSLLLRPDLTTRLRHWKATFDAGEHYWLIGGGELIDAVRRWDGVRTLPSREVHWRCVDLLSASFRTLLDWMPEFTPIAEPEDWPPSSPRPSASPVTGTRHYLVNVNSVYRRDHSRKEDPSLPRLPETWATTTDSIAAWLAIKLQADQLWLLKSCELPDPPYDFTALSAAGVVDKAFTETAARFTGRIDLQTFNAIAESSG